MDGFIDRLLHNLDRRAGLTTPPPAAQQPEGQVLDSMPVPAFLVEAHAKRRKQERDAAKRNPSMTTEQLYATRYELVRDGLTGQQALVDQLSTAIDRYLDAWPALERLRKRWAAAHGPNRATVADLLAWLDLIETPVPPIFTTIAALEAAARATIGAARVGVQGEAQELRAQATELHSQVAELKRQAAAAHTAVAPVEALAADLELCSPRAIDLVLSATGAVPVAAPRLWQRAG